MARVPRRLASEQPAGLTSAEQRVLAAVDGVFDEEELSLVVQQPAAAVRAALDRLAALGAVGFDAPAATLVPAKPEGDGIDLLPDVRERIDRLHERLRSENHYQLLEISPAATKREVRAAYYLLAPRYHPDRHFRKRLGPYKAKIEAIFARLTKAHDELRDDRKRAAYDLAHLGRSIARREAPTPAAAPITTPPGPASTPSPPKRVDGAPVPDRASVPGPAPPRDRASSPGAPPPRQGAASARPAPIQPASNPADRTGPQRALGADRTGPQRALGADRTGPQRALGAEGRPESPEQQQLRRELLAKKLKAAPAAPVHSVAAPRSQKTSADVAGPHRAHTADAAGPHRALGPDGAVKTEPSPVPNPVPNPGPAKSEPKADLGGDVRQRRLQRYLDGAQEAMAAGDYRAAAAAFEQAARLAPEDGELAKKARDAAQRAARKP